MTFEHVFKAHSHDSACAEADDDIHGGSPRFNNRRYHELLAKSGQTYRELLVVGAGTIAGEICRAFVITSTRLTLTMASNLRRIWPQAKLRTIDWSNGQPCG
jgi:hypothetical protein